MTLAPPLRVAPGVHRLSVPLPFPPGEVAAWVIEGDEGPVLVDTGIDTGHARAALGDAAERLGIAPGGLAWVVLTHAHMDHCGLAGAVQAWGEAPLAMHEREERLIHRFVDGWPSDRAGAAEGFVRAGLPEPLARELVAATDATHRWYRRLEPDLLLRGGRGPLPGGGGWEWILTPGHSPGHVVAWHPETRVLIAGDHVLPRISPNVGADLYVADPLTDYLDSLRRLRDLPAEVVLPSHGEPFGDLAGRIDALLAHHAERLEAFRGMLDRPRTAWELTEALFGPARGERALHALRETRAHLAWLERAGRAERLEGEPERWVATG